MKAKPLRDDPETQKIFGHLNGELRLEAARELERMARRLRRSVFMRSDGHPLWEPEDTIKRVKQELNKHIQYYECALWKDGVRTWRRWAKEYERHKAPEFKDVVAYCRWAAELLKSRACA